MTTHPIKPVYYGPETADRLLIQPVTHDDEGIPLGKTAHIRIEDDDSGDTFQLNAVQAQKLINALKLALGTIK